jgi:hypothetical protein
MLSWDKRCGSLQPLTQGAFVGGTHLVAPSGGSRLLRSRSKSLTLCCPVDFARAAQKIDRPINAAQLIDETLLDELMREGEILK